MDLEHQQLDLRYSSLRLRSPRREKKLLASIAEVGQLVPVTVVPSEAGDRRHVVIDGFKRARALRRLKQDVVRAIEWDLPEAEALLLCRSLRAHEGETALEQAWLLSELAARFGLSTQELARQFERGQSWVSRRMALASELPEVVQEQIREGAIAPHAATRFLVPVARANGEDCERMARAIAERGLSTRDVGQLYVGWRDGDEVARERLLTDPGLFLQSRRALAEAQDTPLDLRRGLLKDVEILGAVARRAERRLEEADKACLDALDLKTLLAGLALAANRAQGLAQRLEEQLKEATCSTKQSALRSSS